MCVGIADATNVAIIIPMKNCSPYSKLCLMKRARYHRAIERLGAVVTRPVLGGLHHQYRRI
jgi:hypothetical protein